MATTQNLGTIEVILQAVTSQFTKSMDEALGKMGAIGKAATEVGGTLQNLGKQATIVGGALVGSISAATKSFASMGSELVDMSARTGMSVEAISEWEYVLATAGLTANDMEMSLKRLNMVMYSTRNSTTSVDKMFKAIKLSVADVKKLSPEKQFEAIMRAIAAIEDPAKQSAMALQFFGRQGTRLIPILKEGEAGIKRLKEEAKRFGFTISKEDAEAADALDDVLTQLWVTMKRITFEIGKTMAPEFKDWATTIRNATGDIRDFIDEHRNLIQTLFWIGVALASVGAVLGGLGTALIFVGSLLTALKTTFGVMISFTFLGMIKLLGVILLVATALLLVTDLVLQLTGAGNLGILDMINNFKVLGYSIGTWIQIGILTAQQAWDYFMDNIKIGTALTLITIQDFVTSVYTAVLDLAAKVADAFGMSGAAEWFTEVSNESKAAMGKRNAELDRQIAESKKKFANYEETIDRLKVQDVTLQKKKEEDAEKRKKDKESAAKAGTAEAPTKGTEFSNVNLDRYSLEAAKFQGKNVQSVKAEGMEFRQDLTNQWLGRMYDNMGVVG